MTTKNADAQNFAEDFLEHWGVKGMKWGRRKGDGGGGDRASSSKRDDDSEDFTNSAELAKRAKSGGTRVLSNKELRNLVDRMQLEQNFARINTPEAKKQNPILAGTAFLARKGTNLTGKALEEVIKKNIANEMNSGVQTYLKGGGTAKKANPQLMLFDYK